ncbi:MAG: helix-turn-helix domain-containing protein [Actinomycetes bacterium]|jgi:predicted DNA-binding transcriptional regulator AlpA
MTRDELDALPPVLDVPTAAKVLGIGRSLAYDLVRRGDWPPPVLHVGKLIKIPSAPLLALLSEQPEVTLHADFGERLRA